MKKIFILSIVLSVSSFFLTANSVVFADDYDRQAYSFCANSRLIYAQDKKHLTPDDKAIINGRNGQQLLIVKQKNDDYVIWPITVTVPVLAGDVIYFSGSGYVSFDLLNNSYSFIRKVLNSGNSSPPTIINQDGFLRFNIGEKAREHNYLVLCPQGNPAVTNPVNPNPINYAPVWFQIPSQTIMAGQQIQFSVFANDANGDTLTYSTANLPSGAAFNSANRLFAWTPSQSQVGANTVIFRVTDGINTVDMNVAITVIQQSSVVINSTTINYPPVWLQIPSQTIMAGQQIQFSVFANDANGDTLTYSTANLPSGAAFNSANRLFAWTPSQSQVGANTVIFRVTDGINTVDMNATIIVVQQNNYYGYYQSPTYQQPIYQPIYYQYPQYQYPQYQYPSYQYQNYQSPSYQSPNYQYLSYQNNQPPVWNQVPAQNLNLGQTIQFTVSANDSDGPYLTYSSVNLPAGAAFNPTTRTLNWTPNANQVGSYNLVFRVTDNINNPVDMNVFVSVSQAPIYQAPNYQAPVYQSCQFTSATPTQRVREGDVYTTTVTTNCGSNTSYRVVSGPAGLTISPAFGIVVWVPDFSQGRSEAYPVTVAASNGQNEATQTFYVYVDNVTTNNAPSNTNNAPVATLPVEILKITNLKIENVNGNVTAVWQTNKRATSRVIYDLVSQRDKTRDFTYNSATAEDTQLVNDHKINLGQLEANKIYYLRAVSKANNETAITTEVAFVKLPNGQLTNLGLASLLATLGTFFFSPWLMFLAILILLILLIRSYRQNKKRGANTIS